MLIALLFFAFLAGFVDSIAGGGGLLQLPALFVFLPPALATNLPLVFGTNKFASVWGTSFAATQYVRRVKLDWVAVTPAICTAFVFSFLGAMTVSVLSPKVLKPIVFGLLVVVAIYTYFRKGLGQTQGGRRINGSLSGRLEPRSELPLKRENRFPSSLLRRMQRALLWLRYSVDWRGVVAGCAIGFYDGFFGPGTGTFLIFVFVRFFGFDFLHASASAKLVNVATNIAALILFSSTSNILFHYAIPMAVCNVLGSVVGSRLAILKGNQFVRRIFLCIIAALIIRLGYELVYSH
jgi:uncharacterized membrane protein YfcA